MERRVKLLHAADLHLDSPFEALSPEQAAQSRAFQRETLRRISALAKAERVDLVLLAGDLLDGEGCYQEPGETLVAALRELDVPVFLAPGNHDPYTPGSLYARLRWPENVHIFKSPAIECVPLPALGARVWGAAFTETHSPGLLRGFEAEKQGELLDLLVLHGEVGAPEGGYDPITEEELRRSGMDYAALGHIHRFSSLRRAGDCAYAWPGCPMGRGFDECGEKGVILAEVSLSGTRLRFVPVAERRYWDVTADLTDAEDPGGAVLRALPEDCRNDILRVTLTGETAAAPDLRALQAGLASRCAGLRLRDKTRPKRELWQSAGEDSLRGLFLAELLSRYEAAADETERETIARAARYGLAALENREGPPLE